MPELNCFCLTSHVAVSVLCGCGAARVWLTVEDILGSTRCDAHGRSRVSDDVVGRSEALMSRASYRAVVSSNINTPRGNSTLCQETHPYNLLAPYDMATLLLTRAPLALRAGAGAGAAASFSASFSASTLAPARALASAAPAAASLFRAATFARVGLGVSSLFAAHALATGPSSPLRSGGGASSALHRCDAAGAVRDFGASVRDGVGRYEDEARTPIVSRGGGLNGRAVRQMTVGSMCGEWDLLFPWGLCRGRGGVVRRRASLSVG